MIKKPPFFNFCLGAVLIITTVVFAYFSLMAYDNIGAAKYAPTKRHMIGFLGIHILVWACFAICLFACAAFFIHIFRRPARFVPPIAHEDIVRTGTIDRVTYTKFRGREVALVKIDTPEGRLPVTVSSPIAIEILKRGSTGKRVWVRGTFNPTAGPILPNALSVHHLKILD